MRCYLATSFVLAAAIPLPAVAGELPLYAPSPAWVQILPISQVQTADMPTLALLDTQMRIAGGQVWSYTDKAIKIASPDVLAKLTTLTLPWTPDKGDLIIHELSILRDGKQIDLLAAGQKFTVLRREETLERREVTGILTATLDVAGLQVGDILRLRMSTTTKDAALAGHVQGAQGVIAEPTKIGSARMLVSWPTSEALRWKLLADGAVPQITRQAGFTTLALPLPIAKQPEEPGDAPMRFRRPPMIEVSDFASWRDVSKTMAPLFRTEGTIPAGSPLAAEVAGIEAASASPLLRAEKALELVQDRIRYLAIDMNGGNYIPQAPARTWELRYGDCKAKTLLLLAMLHQMGIDAEPVLASVGAGDLIPDRLASAQAFNHVFVRAQIGTDSLWLDGTRNGSRLADIHDVPGLEHVLPVRMAGADLLTLTPHADARPTIDYSIAADESTSSDLPSAITATAVLRGGVAAMLAGAKNNLGEKQQRQMANSMFAEVVGPQFQVSDVAIAADAVTGTVTVTVHGAMASSWITENRLRKRNAGELFGKQEFAPNRSRPSWSAIPVAVAGPIGVHYHLRLRLPDQGKGAVIEGDPGLHATIAGQQVSRTMTMANGVAELDERMDALGQEIPATDIPAQRQAMAVAISKAPRIVADKNSLRAWQLTPAARAASTQFNAVDAVYGKLAANDPDDVNGLGSRAELHAMVGDRRAAIADLTKAIAIAPAVNLYLLRAGLYEQTGDLVLAQGDADAARQLDSSSVDATKSASWLLARRGNMGQAVALLDEQIANGGQTAIDYRMTKAAIVGNFGDPQDSIRQFDALISEKPGSPDLLNGRCWVKGTRAVMLDTALKDCTSAIELSAESMGALDSRAMVWYRMGRFDDALADLDAVLADVPNLAQSRFLRGVVLKRLHRDAEAETDLQLALTLSPNIESENAVYGVKP